MEPINPNIAIIAYKTGATIGDRAPSAGDGGVKFSDFLERQARETVGTLKHGEVMSARAVADDIELTDVVQAVTAAELTLQTVVAVRDRMIGAYQEIMRMPI